MAGEAFAYSPKEGESTFSFRDGAEEQNPEVFQVPFGVAGDLFTQLPIEDASKPRPSGSIAGTKTVPAGGNPNNSPLDRTDRFD